MKKYIFLALVFLIVAVGFGYGRFSTQDQNPDLPQIKTAEVKQGPITLSISTTGCADSNLDVDIKCKASGEIIALPFDVSDQVKKGDLLLEIDPIDEERNVNQAKATLASSRAQLAQATLSLQIEERNLRTERKRLNANLKSVEVKAKDEASKTERMKELLAKKLISQEEYDASITASVQADVNLETVKIQLEELDIKEIQLDVKREEIKLREAQIERDKISLAINQRRYDETKVVSPIDGTVAFRKVQVGQIISSGITNIGGGDTVLTISDLSRIYVLADVDESEIGEVRVGQAVKITVDAFPNQLFEGKVVRIATAGENVSNVVTFEVKIEVISENKQLLKPGMTADVEILAAERKQALLIPTDAVTNKHNQYYVSVVNATGESEEREIEIGITDYENYEVVKGLQLGERVVINEDDAIDSRWNQNRGFMPPPPPM
ncbi:MAG: efflux RND transporter periplasmic adaptor subunit [Candidatus Omnitrophota bacterium]|jgi:RND family efflux transporter MFP subunit|nr:MAG: efflux RND transporter periplasmic adaptor subunit [Candidatus Omnitrophota bacterium]